MTALYVETSAALRALLPGEQDEGMRFRISEADHLISSRLLLVESTRALHRLRQAGVAEKSLFGAMRNLDALFRHTTLIEMSPAICELSRHVAPASHLRSLDAIHVATFLEVKRKIEFLEIATCDDRIRHVLSS